MLRIFGLCYLEGDSQIALVAVTSNPSALQFPRCTLAQIQRNLLFHQFPAASSLQICLRFAAQKLQNTKKIVLAAVSKEPFGSLHFACSVLCEMLCCYAAMHHQERKDGFALRFATSSMKALFEVVHQEMV